MDVFNGQEVAVAVSGGISAYKTVELVRLLTRRSARVTAIMTRNAQRFIAPLTLETLTGREVVTSLWQRGRHEVEHIALSDRARLVVVAPATANVIGKLAAGIADDFLSTFLISCTCPLVIAPAMNCKMWDHPAVQRNVATLRSWGLNVMRPNAGYLACGYEGRGRMPEPDEILAAAEAALTPQDLAGLTCLITTGPTREFLDPARYLSNPSTGKMGDALAATAVRRGARVLLVRGPVDRPPPAGCEVFPVVSAADMFAAVSRVYEQADVLIGCAAVADFRPADPLAQKLKKDGLTTLTVAMERTPDILAFLGERKGHRCLIGFAAETSDLLANARDKLERKRADMIVANPVNEPDAGFAVDTNRAWLIRHGAQPEELPLLPKRELADYIWNAIVKLRNRESR